MSKRTSAPGSPPCKPRPGTPLSPARPSPRSRAWSGPGLADDLLLANEVVDATRLGALVRGGARVTMAVDAEPIIEAAAAAGVPEVLVDVNVGLPRCGCRPEDAGRLAGLARRRGLAVRGVMGYEGHIVGLADRVTRIDMLAVSMEQLMAAAGRCGR